MAASESSAPTDPLAVDMPLRVRYVECDRMGVAHHSHYPVWFEMGRTELLRSLGMTYRQCEDAGIFFVVTYLEIRFRAPAHYDDELLLRTTQRRMTRVRIDHDYRLTREGIVLCEAHSTIGCVDRSGRVSPIPSPLRPAD